MSSASSSIPCIEGDKGTVNIGIGAFSSPSVSFSHVYGSLHERGELPQGLEWTMHSSYWRW